MPTKTAVVAPERAVRCAYKRRNLEMCSNQAADQAEDAHIRLCAHHLARAMQLVNEQIAATKAIWRTTT
jgi:hypothetical protein